MKKTLYVIFLLAIIWAGFSLGRVTGGDVVADATRDLRTEFPDPPPPPEEEDMPDFSEVAGEKKLVIVEMPVEDSEIDGTLLVSGRADAAFKKVLVTLKSGSGELLVDEEAVVTGGSGEVYGRFSVEIDLTHYEPGVFEVTVMGIATDGIEETVRRTIALVREDAVSAKVFFTNADLPGENDDICLDVQPVERTVSSRTNIYRAVLERLADGPTKDELAQGYATSLPKGVILRSVAADANGVVTADFTASLDHGVAGSCRVGSIRAQIEETLSQFPEVREVVITVNGDADTALQP